MPNVIFAAPYFSEHVRRYLLDKFGKTALYEEGLKVYTTVDTSAQIAAQSALDSGLQKIDKRLGYRPPEQNFPSEMTRQAFLSESHKKIVEETYDFKLLKSEGILKSPVELSEPTPLSIEAVPSCPKDTDRAHQKRTASAPYTSIRSRGSTTLPSDLEIFRSSSRR